MPSQRKLNTDGVESPCERLPRVGSFLANPGLSKEQLVPSCVMRTFIMVDISLWSISIKYTALNRCNIHPGRCVHWNIDVKPALLRSCNIRNDECIHWNVDIKPTTLHDENIRSDRYIHWDIGIFCYLIVRMLASIVLWNTCFNAVGVAPLIAQGCQTIVQATLG